MRLVLTASPRKNGYTASLVRAVFPDAEIVKLYGAPIEDCRACKVCGIGGKCVHDDMMNELYSRLAEAELIVLATPVWFGSFPAPMKKFMDRLNFFYHNKISHAPQRRLICLCTMGSRDERDVTGCARLAKICANMLSAEYLGTFAVFGTDDIDESNPTSAFAETIKKVKSAIAQNNA